MGGGWWPVAGGRWPVYYFPPYLLSHNPAPSDDDDVLADEPVTTFAATFRPQFWWFEIYNMFRRLMLTCAVLLCATLAEVRFYQGWYVIIQVSI